ncbi:hypothetical protein [Streptomyces bauhiniae]|uniref:hypothetical protein n=1 Tax=Streptomyces bauhiniae TaxID=2340725 RepID=UPI001EF25B1B|nr:hypothetical protein [Streptomyces bauhiniae]
MPLQELVQQDAVDEPTQAHTKDDPRQLETDRGIGRGFDRAGRGRHHLFSVQSTLRANLPGTFSRATRIAHTQVRSFRRLAYIPAAAANGRHRTRQALKPAPGPSYFGLGAGPASRRL